jgi:hypothetical protein
MAPVNDVKDEGAGNDEITLEEIDDFLAGSSDSDDDNQIDGGFVNNLS